MNSNPSILFITRSYPPVKGGMEQLSYDITTELGKLTKTKVIANKHGKKFLPLFYIYALFRGIIEARNFNIIHIGDPVLCGIGFAIKKIIKKPVAIEVHGLDIQYRSKIYQWYLRNFFNADLSVCISSYVADVFTNKFPQKKFVVITPGISDVFFEPNLKKEDLSQLLKQEINDKKIILTVGRLVQRKGVAWFIGKVLPQIVPNALYVVAGNGPEKNNVINVSKKVGQEKRTVFLENLSREEIKILYNTADLFAMPNIKIAGDVEGFGLVAAEASSCNLPVIASSLEGINDVVKDNQNGLLVDPENSQQFINKINDLLSNEEKRKNLASSARKFALDNFSWEKIARQYLNEFSKIAK